MKKHMKSIGSFALALSVVGMPAIAAAQTAVQAAGGVQVQGTSVNVGGMQITTDEEGTSEVNTEEVQVNDDDVRAGGVQVNGEAKGQQSVQVRGQSRQEQSVGESSVSQINEGDGQEVDLELEDSGDVAYSAQDLSQKIEVRKHQLEQEVASSSPDHQAIVENANSIRLAVRSLLASKELLGGIGSQVSEIAKQMNDSVATTTHAEERIQSRGFFTKLFFGGDKDAAETINQEVTQNQQRIDTLTELLGKTTVSADVQATLTAQIAALKDAQARLQGVAQSEKKQWGIFSWRLF